MGSTTYMCLGNKENPDAGILELDLVVFREKGEQTRYLSISFAQPDEKGNMKSVSINLNEESFQNVKKFFEQLDWQS